MRGPRSTRASASRPTPTRSPSRASRSATRASRSSRRNRAHAMKSEYAFTLPRGLVDSAGTVHRDGVMRLATARDEIEPLRSVEVRQNEAYLTVLLLARTVTRIGEFTEISPELIEGLFASDF